MSDQFNTDAEKDPDELEREVDQQRAYIAETLQALEQKFSPGQIFDQIIGYTRSNGGDFSQNLVNTVKNNPVPTLLTATGIAWMMLGQNRPTRARDSSYIPANASYGVDPAYQSSGDGKTAALKERAGHLREGASESMAKAKQKMHHLGSSASSARETMRQRAAQANEGFDHMLKEQPLALAAIGIALGALIGAAVPHTRKEDELLGESRDKVAQQAKEKAQEGYEKAEDLGSRLAEDAKQEVKSTQTMSSQPSASASGSPRYN